MKIAIVHDELVRKGGAEQVTLLIHKAFPEAPIYTSSYNAALTYDGFNNCDIRTSWINKFARNETWLKRLFYPFVINAMKRMDVSEYDVVFISTTTGAKFVKTSSKSTVIAFCHYPFRLAWFPESYDEVKNAAGIKKRLFETVVKRLRTLDFNAVKKIDWLITNTTKIKQIITSCYQPKNEVTVIPASIPVKNFYVADQPSRDYFLVVSRFEPYKKIDLVIEAFNQLPAQKLIIVGKGSQKAACVKMAEHNKNIVFKENLPAQEIADLYANANALVFPQEEDYGLTPLEANASGIPVIAYGKGGVLDTMIPYSSENQSNATALFFEKQTAENLIAAILMFAQIQFNPTTLRAHAEKFDEAVFIEKIRRFVAEKRKL